jgi:hypothetical protein
MSQVSGLPSPRQQDAKGFRGLLLDDGWWKWWREHGRSSVGKAVEAALEQIKGLLAEPVEGGAFPARPGEERREW